MSNTGNTQQIIDYGAAANDGTGDPLRTAFIKTDENFSNIWLAGPVGSNITISNNTVQTNNTNGNLVLKPNGTGVVQANAHVLPNSDDIRNLGSPNRRWRTAYLGSGGLDLSGPLSASDVSISGNLTVGGNLTVEGDVIEIGNITSDSLQIQLANAISVDALANSAGIVVGSNRDIATLTYDSSADAWKTNIGLSAQGNISGSNLRISSLSNTWTISGQFITGPGGAYWHSHPEQQQSEFVSAPGEFVTIKSVDANLVTQASLYLGNAFTEIFVENGINRRWRFDETGVMEAAGDILPVTAAPAANIGNATLQWTHAWFSGNVTSGNLVVSSAGNTWTITDQFIYGPGGAYWHSHPEQQQSEFVSAPGEFISIRSVNTSNITEAELFLGNTYAEIFVENGVNHRWRFNEDATMEAAGDILPVTNLSAANLGNATLQWTHAWFSGNVTVGNIIGNGSQLTGLNTSSIVNGTSNVDIATANGNVAVTAAGTQTWTFGLDGNLTLPSEGNIVGVTPNNSGHLQWVGNSSGDGVGFTTMQLVPDSTLGPDQRIIVDPTGPNHIHLRAGGTQDDSSAQLYLGGENSHFKVDNGLNPNVYATANSYKWTFGSDGNLSLPGDNVSTAFSRITSLANSSGDGAGYTTLSLIPDINLTGGDQYLIVDPTAPGHIHIRAGGTQDNSSADLFLGGENSYFRVAAGANAQAQITSNSNTWVFDTDGNLQVPGNINGDNSAPLVIDGASSGEGFISLPSASFGGEQIAIVNKFMAGNGIRLETNGGNLFFDNNADLSVTGNITGNTAGFAIGYRDIPQVSFTGNATIAAGDAGKHFYSTESTDYVLTIANNTSVSWSAGTAITVVNRGTGNITIAQDTGVSLYLAGNSTAGNRTLTTYGMATLLNVAGNVWMINGTGVV